MSRPELSWIKAERSVGTGACVELAVDGELIAMRNSREPGRVIHYTRGELAAFLHGAKSGEFDHLVE
jgi:hypothetical protein